MPFVRPCNTWLALALALLAGCGFQLRGAYALPYESLYLAMPDYVVIGASLKRAIRSSASTRLALTASDAEATLLPGAEYRDRVVLSVSGTGRVSELRLRYLYNYRVTDAKGRKVDFRNVLLLMTSNIGAKLIQGSNKFGFSIAEEDFESRENEYESMKAKVMDALKKSFRPEFVNRLDGIMVFRSLARDIFVSKIQ